MSAYDPKYAKRWRVDRDRGITRYVDAGPTLRHVQDLIARGASRRAIADRAGCSTHVVCHILDGQEKVQRRIANAVLRVAFEDLFDRQRAAQFVPKIGAVRRIQALMAIGHRAQDIAGNVGRGPALVHNIVNQSGQWVSRDNFNLIATAYDRMWATPGQSTIMRSRAKTNGWAPPLAWDDDTIDDPQATPHLEAEQRPGGKRIHLDDVEFLVDHGHTRDQAAHRLGVHRSSLEHACARGDRRDLLERMKRNAIAQETAA